MNKGTARAESDAPLGGLNDSMARYIELGVAPSKLVLGLASFATDYTCNATRDRGEAGGCTKITPWEASITRRPYAGALGSGAFADPSAMQLLAHNASGPVRWDASGQAPYFEYFNGSVRHQVWFQNNDSVAARDVQIVRRFGLRGMGVFMGDYLGGFATAAPIWHALQGLGRPAAPSSRASATSGAGLPADAISVPRVSAYLEHGLVKVRPESPAAAAPPPPQPLALYAARNEYTSLQVVLNGPAAGVVVTATPPCEGCQVLVHAIRYHDVVNVSNCQGALGLWPDALVPARDVFVGEERNAFPMAVPAGQRRGAWIDLFVPPGTAPGDYRGSVLIEAEGVATPLNLSYTLEVAGFVLPSTSTLHQVYGFEPASMCTSHGLVPHSTQERALI